MRKRSTRPMGSSYDFSKQRLRSRRCNADTASVPGVVNRNSSEADDLTNFSDYTKQIAMFTSTKDLLSCLSRAQCFSFLKNGTSSSPTVMSPDMYLKVSFESFHYLYLSVSMLLTSSLLTYLASDPNITPDIDEIRSEADYNSPYTTAAGMELITISYPKDASCKRVSYQFRKERTFFLFKFFDDRRWNKRNARRNR